jgi:hypothetical protein
MPEPFFSAWGNGRRRASLDRGAIGTKSSGDLHYIVAGIALLVSGGIGLVAASQIVVTFGPRFHSIGGHVKQRSASFLQTTGESK